ncbi:MAG: hypothetical protein JNM43_24505 [Planctomycetaceae bacterium]|nr:hypothetical protein [Planctomycetaceae bacterium]
MIEPPLSQWPSEPWQPASETLASLRQRAQDRLITESRRWLAALYQSEQRSVPEDLLIGTSPRSMVVMTGHQPVIFHPGLAAKYVVAESFASQHQATAIALIIDTDEGDAGELQYPSAETSGSVTTKKSVSTVSIASNNGLYHSSQLRSASEREAVFSKAMKGLRDCGCADEATRAEKIFQDYLALQTTSTIAANTLIRRSRAIGGHMLEIPLSSVCCLPEVLQFFGAILHRASDFHHCYNTSLDQFRTEHNIRNDANPFPNLKHSGDQFELPFWVVNTASGTREIVSLTTNNSERWLCAGGSRLTEMHRGLEMENLTALLFQGLRLVPRGALITATLRLLFSDVFIHGTGGGRYDEFTDRLIHAWWKEQPSPVAVVTTSQYLFEEQRQRFEKLQTLNSQLRDLQFNPQRYFGQAVFSPDDEQRLAQLVAQRDERVAMMKSQRGEGQSGKQLGREIQQLNDQLKDTVAALIAPSLQELQQFDEATVKTLQTRTWPWFYFDGIVV